LEEGGDNAVWWKGHVDGWTIGFQLHNTDAEYSNELSEPEDAIAYGVEWTTADSE